MDSIFLSQVIHLCCNGNVRIASKGEVPHVPFSEGSFSCPAYNRYPTSGSNPLNPHHYTGRVYDTTQQKNDEHGRSVLNF